MASSTSPITSFNTQENMETKVLTILSDKYPTLDCGPGTPVYEMVVRPIAYLWSRQASGIEEIIDALSFTNYTTMNEEDLDRLMSRYFLSRRTGVVTNGTVRCIVDTLTIPTEETDKQTCEKDIAIAAGEIWETDDGRTYEVLSNHTIKADDWEELDEYGLPIHKYTDSTGTNWIYFIDIGVVSTGTGNLFNAAQNDKINPTGASAININSAYFLAATNDGGEDESNYDFYTRAKDELAFRGMCSYKSTSALIRDNFPLINQVVSVGLKDPEMIRDLAVIKTAKNPLTIGTQIQSLVKDIFGVTLPTDNAKLIELGEKAEDQAVTTNTIHLGGKCDLYVKPTIYFTETGYTAPLGFPLEYQTLTLKSNAAQLRELWNSSVSILGLEDKNKRGSLEESIPGLADTVLTNLKGDINDISTYVESGEDSSLHTDNLVKQMWPIVVIGKIKISSDNADEDIDLAKTTLTKYINSLKSTEAPQVAEIAHLLRSVGINSVHMPMELYAYYLTDDLHMEYFGLNKEYSENSLLIPIEDDSLKFTIPSDKTSQISIRTCTWYSNNDLFTIEVED